MFENSWQHYIFYVNLVYAIDEWHLPKVNEQKIIPLMTTYIWGKSACNLFNDNLLTAVHKEF